ncbi:MAG: alpha/beta hydrolase [Kiritimatiellae bacterium]|nr:alpha/beta hydrolase [Kiritimatiellia bacterium]
MMKKLFKSLVRIGILAMVLGLLVGMGCINSMMFHPEFCKGNYDVSTPGYIDIGTNGIRIAAVVRGPKRGKKAIIRCHGNAEDMIGSLWVLGELADVGYTVASVDYPGYGLSDGSPDEEGCYRNVHRLYDWLVETHGFSPTNIFVDGFSIGTGPATELAATRPVGGLILEAPFLSAPRVVTRVRILPIDPFPNLKRIADVKCPVLIIHGTADNIVPYAQGKKLFKLANEPKRFVSVKGADHNQLPIHLGKPRYRQLIIDFMEKGLK